MLRNGSGYDSVVMSQEDKGALEEGSRSILDGPEFNFEDSPDVEIRLHEARAFIGSESCVSREVRMAGDKYGWIRLRAILS